MNYQCVCIICEKWFISKHDSDYICCECYKDIKEIKEKEVEK
ncbi:hypothetical protein vBBcePLY3_00015 [Bacillus phage vB_BceP_LY3]|uniref:Uncharacterized protein n=1 Tax=Bacillus phage vB_BceP_LY3 TaxID=2950458 RepID=A0AAE9S201_9CAUD|nr:hypothetical protein vBBcePLY3_00015 [Bacillus phage vB_BceP_LY3]